MTDDVFGADKRYKLIISENGVRAGIAYTNDLSMIQDAAIKATLEGFDVELIDRAPDHPAGSKL